jgi:hypothetical protein
LHTDGLSYFFNADATGDDIGTHAIVLRHHIVEKGYKQYAVVDVKKFITQALNQFRIY